jgi:hypothetical protein
VHKTRFKNNQNCNKMENRKKQNTNEKRLDKASPFPPFLSLIHILPICFDSAQVLYIYVLHFTLIVMAHLAITGKCCHCRININCSVTSKYLKNMLKFISAHLRPRQENESLISFGQTKIRKDC